jgi:hypothetical protein
MAQNKIVRHHTIGTGLWLFVLAASMAGWVLALVWVAYLFDGSRRVAMNRRVKRMLFFESRLFWPKYRELLNSTGRLCIRHGNRPSDWPRVPAPRAETLRLFLAATIRRELLGLRAKIERAPLSPERNKLHDALHRRL